MKIGIDCRMLSPEQGGLGRYAEQLIYHLSLIDHTNEYILFLRAANFNSVKIGHEQFKYTKVLADIPWYGWREQILFPKILQKEKVDLMHFPHWNVPILYRKNFVVTVHDLLLIHYPTRAASTLCPAGYWFKNVAYRLVLKNAVKRARHIFTTSEFTKNDVHKTLGVPKEKMTVSYQAPTSALSESAAKNKIAKITKPYILYVGVAFPHKNLERLVEAWKLVQEKTGPKYQLVLVGKTNYFYDRLAAKIYQEKITDVIMTGFVADKELTGLYAQAELYVFPSLYEGFGLPPLDAWVYNLPVVASNLTCLPEILGEGALYFDPESTLNMANTITVGLTNANLRQELRLAAGRELSRFSWKKLATVTCSIYNKILSR